ncbi:Rv1733c family protein [Mycobacterium parmense]|uniref:Membrane protein n=1 Tax=Mycobacterium parmense TaxID=185642 RepID=A0A7I7YVR8_9MYCO|nr:hypothetical protein [Mycobacterium parmense]MCV7351155.1 hypothetical protein [Mycobacterium parmense]ORW60706.1 hypothetical protein AWC20_07025 [Mycobacterium parmense]BBZ45397.1 membrane protein [Mycobacterium parmense]
MEMFTVNPRSWRLARIFGRNPLLRRADRVEALVVLVAVVVALSAVPVCAVVGAVTYGARDRAYAQEALERHRVTATVTDARAEDLGATLVQVKWRVDGAEHTGTVVPADPAKLGDRIDIWVDKGGNPVGRPTPSWLAVGEGLAMAVVTMLCVAALLGLLVAMVRSRLDRARYAGWERELGRLAEDGGRKHRQ